MNEQQTDYKFLSFALVALFILCIMGYCIWLVRGILPIIGYVIIGILILATGCGVAVMLAWTWRFVTQIKTTEIPATGLLVQSITGRELIAPMTSNRVKVAKYRNTTVVEPDVPTLEEMITDGVIQWGLLQLHMGFTVTKSGLIPEIDQWPGSILLAGTSGSGKSRRAIMTIIQALFGEVRILLCDPHEKKPDGLAKLLAPLGDYITIASGKQQILQLAETFENEMCMRMEFGVDNPVKWLIIFDEWAHIMRRYSEDEKELLLRTVLGAANEYRGFGGFAMIITQVLKEDAMGDTEIRRGMAKTFLHQISLEYASYIFEAKWARLAASQPKKYCVYRDAGGGSKQIITPFVGDEAVVWVANWLKQHMPVEYLPDHLAPLQLERPKTRVSPVSEPENMSETPLLEASKGYDQMTEELGDSTETAIDIQREQSYTEDEEKELLNGYEAYVASLAENQKPSRKGLRLFLGKNAKWHTRVIVPVLNNHKLLMQKEN